MDLAGPKMREEANVFGAHWARGQGSKLERN